MATLNNLNTSILRYGGDEVADISEDSEVFFEMVNQALVNVHTQVCNAINKWIKTSLTVGADGFEITLPANWDRVSKFLVFSDSRYQNLFDDVEVEFGALRFETQQTFGRTFYVRYRQAASVYDDLETIMPELENPRLKKIIMEEVIAIYLSRENDLETSNAEQSTLNKANRNA